MSTVIPTVPPATHYRRDKLDVVVTRPSPKPLLSTSSAKERLVASRQHIRSELMLIAHPPAKPTFFARPGSLSDKLQGVLLDLPGVAPVSNAIGDWWADHPARQAGAVAGRVSATLVQPVAREYPRSVLVVAGVIGASLVLAKPWRWLRPKHVLSVAAQIGMSKVKKPRKMPWLALLASVARSR